MENVFGEFFESAIGEDQRCNRRLEPVDIRRYFFDDVRRQVQVLEVLELENAGRKSIELIEGNVQKSERIVNGPVLMLLQRQRGFAELGLVLFGKGNVGDFVEPQIQSFQRA